MKGSALQSFRIAAVTAAIAVVGCSSDTAPGEPVADGGTTPGPAGDAGATGDADDDDDGVPSAVECSPLEPVPPRLWRLSPTQFSNSVRDLLELPQGPAVSDTGGSAEYAFFSDTSGTVNNTLAFSLHQAVQWALDQARPRLTELAACTTDESEDECATSFAQTFGAQAFRRPLEATEVDALLEVYAEGRRQDFNTGIESMVEALLQSPSFLYRSEVGTPNDEASEVVLTPYEVATQLAYLFLDSTPDAELIAAAENGELSTPEEITAQVDRLLAMDTVRQNINRIVVDWFGVRQVLSKTTKAARLLSNLQEVDRDQGTLALDLLTSTRLFLDDVLWQRGLPLNDLLRSRRMYVNRRLATLYGLPFTGSPDEFIAVYFPTAEQRAGILTQPAVLWAASDPEATSIVHRGLYVHNDVLCLEPLPSPGDLLEQPDIKEALAMLTTEREKSEFRDNDPTCRTCHRQIDPYGLVLESFDPVGAHRATADGEPVDPSGEFMVSPSLSGRITGAAAFAEGASEDALFTACATQKMASYALGRNIQKRATCEVQEVHAEFTSSDGTIERLFRRIALARFLRVRTGDTQ